MKRYKTEGFGMTRAERERTDPNHYFCLSCLEVHILEDYGFEQCKKWGIPYEDYVTYTTKYAERRELWSH